MKYVEIVFLIQFFIIIKALFPMWDIAIFHKNAGFKKNIFLFAAVGQTSYQNRKKYEISQNKNSSWI